MGDASLHKRKIAVAVTHRTPYGRLKPVLRAIREHPGLQLQVIVGTPVFMRYLLFALRHAELRSLRASLPWYLRARWNTFWGGEGAFAEQESLTRAIRRDGFSIDAYLPWFLEGGNLVTMTKSVASALLGLPEIFEKLRPDIVLVHADRFEMLAVATAASLMNIPLAHTQGGDVSGTIDETIRHAITKLAHIHFPTTEKSRERLLRMGEDPRFVFNVGCPTIDILKKLDFTIDEGIVARNGKGYGDHIDFAKPFLLVLQHPVTTEYARAYRDMEETLEVIRAVRMPTLFFWPNLDAGSDGASAALRHFMTRHGLPAFLLHKSFGSEDFYRVLNAASVAVGNSSSFLREGSYLGTPAVLVGSRQRGRERAGNVIEVENDRHAIQKAVAYQLTRRRYPQSTLYGDGTAALKIAEILATVAPKIQKEFYESR